MNAPDTARMEHTWLPLPARLDSVASVHSISEQRFATGLLDRLHANFDARCALEELIRATNGEFYVLGGTSRRAVLQQGSSGDLDLMVPNGDHRAFKCLDALRVPFILNRHRHRRYSWNTLQMDIFQPQTFYKGFENVEDVLRYFDLRVNAIALHLGTQKVIDPFSILPHHPVDNPGVNWPRWNEMGQPDLTILSLRLLRIMYESPAFVLPIDDVDRLREVVMPQLACMDWDLVRDRFPPGRSMFLRRFETIVLQRVKSSATESSESAPDLITGEVKCRATRRQ
jgi:hypothetical protein